MEILLKTNEYFFRQKKATKALKEVPLMRNLSEPRGSWQETERWLTKLKTIMYAKCTRLCFICYIFRNQLENFDSCIFVNICLLMNQCFLLQKRHRGESLMDIHSKKLEKQKVKNWFTSFYVMESRGIGKIRWAWALQSGYIKVSLPVLRRPVFRKMVKFNPGLTQILNKESLLRYSVMITQNVTLRNA